MHYKSLFKGIGLAILFSLVKSEDCDYLDKYNESIICYSDDNNVPYYLALEDNYDNAVLNDITKLTTLKEIAIHNTLNVTADYSILNKLNNLTKLTYDGVLEDAYLKSISKLTHVTDLTLESSVDGNVNLKSLKGLKLQKLTVECNNVEIGDSNYLVKKTLNTFASTLKELTLNSCFINKNEDFSSLTKLNTFNAAGWLDKNLIKKISDMPALKKVYIYFDKYDIGDSDIYTIDVTDLKSASKLNELILDTYNDSLNPDQTRLKHGALKGLKKLKNLDLGRIALDQENIDEISNIKAIESLSFRECPLLSEDDLVPTFDSLLNLKKNLKNLYFSFGKRTTNKFEEVPEFIYSLTNLKSLTITNALLETLSDEIVNLKKLEHLDLSMNYLTSLPANLEKLKNLKYIDLHQNRSLEGKSLNNSKLEYCDYDRTKICKDKEVKCFENYESKIEPCSSE